MRKISIIFLIIASLLLSGCPQGTALEKSAKASYRLTGLTATVIDKTKEAFTSGDISLETKDKLADALIVLSRSEQIFIRAVREADELFRATGNLPKDKLLLLSRLFSSEIVAPFLEILKLIVNIHSEAVLAAVAALRTVILLISNSIAEVKT